MIRSFANKETLKVAAGVRSRSFPPDIQDRAFRLLRQTARVGDWNDMRYPPGNKLHALGGDRHGQFALRINRQWRIVFTPVDGMLEDVEITDYH
jgi:proteic killer suppression protein